MTDRTQVAIVGAGITGLTIAYHLRRFGIGHLVFEASDRVGGVIRSGRVDGSLLEWGPQRTRLTPGLRELLGVLEIAEEVVTAPRGLPLFVYRDRKLRRVPFSIADFLLSDVVPFRSKLRVLAEPLTRGARPEESVAAYFTRKLGRRFYENLAGPLYGGLYASDPADMVVGLSLGHVLAEFRAGRSLVWTFLRRGGSVDPPPACSFREGMETLPRALHRVSAENVRLSEPVVEIRPDSSGWVLRTTEGELRADRIVLTAPAPAVAKILTRAAPGAAAAAATLTYNPLAVVHLRASTALRGLGYQVSLAERLLTRGVTFNDSLFDRRGVYTAYLGGAKAPEVIGWADEAVGAAAVREFRTITGYESEVLSVEREWMPAWDASWRALERVRVPAGIHLATNWESRPGIPGRLAQAKRLAESIAYDAAASIPPV